MTKPMPELVTHVFGEQPIKCGECGKDFIVRNKDVIDLLGYKAFGVPANVALWSTPCPHCGKAAVFMANDVRGIAIDHCIPCYQCGLFALLAETKEEWRILRGCNPLSFTCKSCGCKNILTVL